MLCLATDTQLNHGAMPRDTGLQDFIDRLSPPVVGKNLDLGITRKALRLDRAAYRFDIDHAVAHHAPVVENIPGRHQPVADMKGQQPVLAGADDLRQQFRVPPDVIDIKRYTQTAGARWVQPVADIER